MSKASGLPLNEYWKVLDKHDKEKVLFQLGTITWQLSELQFDQAGSLFEENEGFQIKTCLSRGLLMYERYSLDDLHRGPFNFETEYYQALLSAFLQHVQFLPLAHHCFFAPIPAPNDYDDNSEYQTASGRWSDFVTLGSKIDGSDNRSDYVVVGEVLREILSTWSRRTFGPASEGQRDRFALHHPDLSVNNIFVDNDCNITCIIDWAFCSSVPFSILLTSPGLPQSRN
jgi:hypothetical protein